MFKSGLLVVTLPLHKVLSNVGGLLKQASNVVSNVIYIRLEPHALSTCNASKQTEFMHVVPNIYRIASKRTPEHDIRVILGSFPWQLKYPPEILLTDRRNALPEWPKSKPIDWEILELISKDGEEDMHMVVSNENFKKYDHCCLGGTFDHLHNGHKVMLNEAIVRCDKRLVVGVTDNSILRRKTLYELISPVEQRIQLLNEYLQDVNPELKYEIMPIFDGYGPSIEIKELQCLIVSEETLTGGQMVNDRRVEREMTKLELFITKILSDEQKEFTIEEDKVSSSSLRIRRLGTIIHEPKHNPNLPKRPYLIGLTGGICSGKSTLLEKLKELGAATINCDLLAHQTYSNPNSLAYKQIVESFGEEKVLDENKAISREKLGKLVFGNREKLQKLNEIVWPATDKLIQDQLNKYSKSHEVIVLEAALLLEANWEYKCHQVWVAIISEEEAINRLEKRNGLNREDAIARIKSQMSNSDRVKRANIVFCSLWDLDVTRAQVDKAWKILNEKYLIKEGNN